MLMEKNWVLESDVLIFEINFAILYQEAYHYYSLSHA